MFHQAIHGMHVTDDQSAWDELEDYYNITAKRSSLMEDFFPFSPHIIFTTHNLYLLL